MIRLTKADGTAWYPAVEHIIEVDVRGEETVVRTVRDGFFVKESPEEVVDKIIDYKLSMARYPIANALALLKGDGMSPGYEKDETEWTLRNLAGLEADSK